MKRAIFCTRPRMQRVLDAVSGCDGVEEAGFRITYDRGETTGFSVWFRMIGDEERKNVSEDVARFIK